MHPKPFTVAIVGFLLESNRFAPVTCRSDFQRRCWLEGASILEDAASPNPRQAAEVPAFLDEIARHGEVRIVPTIVAGAEPGGPLDDTVLQTVIKTTVQALAEAGPVDGVYIASHGAMTGVEEGDPDGALIEAIRAQVGPDVPIVATLDLHANISDRMVAATNCLIGYRTNPHTDQAQVAREAAIILSRMMAGERFHQAFIRLPLTPPSVTLFTNALGAYAERVADAGALTDPKGDVVNATILGGFVYSDTPDNGLSVLVTATDQHRAEREAARLAGKLWRDRHRFDRALTSIDDAMAKITASDGARWILSDSGDNPGGGGRGNTTELLAALIDGQARDVLYGMYIDPGLAAAALYAGVGATFTARFPYGGAETFGEPIVTQVDVLAVSDGEVVGRRGLVAGKAMSLGPTVALAVGGITVVVASQRVQCADPIYFEHLGFNPGGFRTVVVKSRGHFRAGFDEFFSPDQVLEVDTKGLTSPVLANFTFTGLPPPVYPLDPDASWQPPSWAEHHLKDLRLNT